MGRQGVKAIFPKIMGKMDQLGQTSTYSYNEDWSTPLAMWGAIAKQNQKPRVLNGLGLAYSDVELLDEGITTLKKAIAVDPKHIKNIFFSS